MSYPTQHLFQSADWTGRSRELSLDSPKFQVQKLRGLRVASLRTGLIADFESWPSREELERLPRELSRDLGKSCDWVVFRKLLPEHRPDLSGIPAFITDYSVSPFIELAKPLKTKKEVHSHILRTERKITREVGPLELREADSSGREEWFQVWSGFEAGTGRFDEEKLALFRSWVMSGELPPWMKLMSLWAGGRPIAAGLFYAWQGVFYYYAPVMSQDPELRKYGPGKLFVHKLIEYARAQGCEIFDFLQGGHAYKFHWNPEIRPLQQCILPVSMRGRAALAAFRAKRSLDPILRTVRQKFRPEAHE